MTTVRFGSSPIRFRVAAAVFVTLLSVSGCASAGHLAEYEFRGRSMGAVTLNAPRAELLTSDMLDVDMGNPLQAALRIGADLVKEVEAARTRPRLQEAAVQADVPGRMRERVLHGMAGELRAVPTLEPDPAEFEVEVVIQRYGIDADAWLEPAHFFVESEVVLRDVATGRRIWKGKVTEREAITSRILGLSNDGMSVGDATNDMLTAAALTSLSTEEMVLTLEALADFASDAMLREFRKGVEKSRS